MTEEEMKARMRDVPWVIMIGLAVIFLWFDTPFSAVLALLWAFYYLRRAFRAEENGE